VIAAPSGAGKSSIVRDLLAREGEVVASVSVTTRAPRSGEAEGKDYFFRTRAEFEAMVAGGALLEHADVFGRGYGTPRAPVEHELACGRDVLLDIDWQGWRQIRAAMPADCVGVFVLPPSIGVLEARLRGRASDSEAEVQRRMRAAQAEIGHWNEFDYLVVNDSLAACVDEVIYIMKAERARMARRTGLGALAMSMLDQ